MTTKIEWTDETWNPVTGCTKVSQGCKNCYAERLWPKVSGAEAKRTGNPPRAFTDVRTHPERLDAPRRWAKPKRIFVNSMSDLFHEDVPYLFIDQVFQVMLLCLRHQFQILTKRPERALAYFHERPHYRPLTHIWLGVSVEDQATADERIPLLLQTPSAVRFVSYEPALGPVKLKWKWVSGGRPISGGPQVNLNKPWEEPKPTAKLDWLIAGGESGPHARPAHPDWFRAVRNQCAAAGVPFFFKQWGEYGPSPDAGLPDHLPSDAGFYFDEPHTPGKVWRFGKKAAGRTLDGRTHDEYPA